MARIRTTATETSITATLEELNPAYAFNDRVCSWYLDNVFEGTSTLGAGVESGGTFRFRGLDSGTSYYIVVSIDAPDWASPVVLDAREKTDDPPAPTVDPWSWSSSNGSASSSKTASAYNAVENKRGTDEFSYLVWNDLVSKINEVQDSKSISWDSDFASYSSTKMSSSDKRMTAIRFNSILANINPYYDTGINYVSKGDLIYGWYFTHITYCINKWI